MHAIAILRIFSFSGLDYFVSMRVLLQCSNHEVFHSHRYRPFNLLIAPNAIKSVVRAAGTKTTFVPVPATVLGRYYLSYQRLLDTEHGETAQLTNPSLYCTQFPHRPALQHWFSGRAAGSSLVNIQLAEDDATLEITEQGSARVSA